MTGPRTRSPPTRRAAAPGRALARLHPAAVPLHHPAAHPAAAGDRFWQPSLHHDSCAPWLATATCARCARPPTAWPRRSTTAGSLCSCWPPRLQGRDDPQAILSSETAQEYGFDAGLALFDADGQLLASTPGAGAYLLDPRQVFGSSGLPTIAAVVFSEPAAKRRRQPAAGRCGRHTGWTSAGRRFLPGFTGSRGAQRGGLPTDYHPLALGRWRGSVPVGRVQPQHPGQPAPGRR